MTITGDAEYPSIKAAATRAGAEGNARVPRD